MTMATRSIALLAVVFTLAAGRMASAQDLPPGIQPLEDFSPGFLGMYRKVMVIESEIRRYAEAYGVDFDLARAVCLHESGGNAGLASGAGARGYFQVMPPTFRSLRVSSNIEAGVKYLSQMIRQFEREDRAIAAYNAGPGRINRGGAIPIETLQYVLGVGQYRAVLKQFDASLRHHASSLQLATVRTGDDWPGLAARLGLPLLELQMHNPFLATRRLRVGQLVAYPTAPRGDLIHTVDGRMEYRMRHGDNYLNLAFTMGIEPDALRAENGLWQLQVVPAGISLRIPAAGARPDLLNAAALEAEPADDPAVDDVEPAVAQPAVDRVERASRVATPAPASRARTVTHRVGRGDTLYAIAQRYDTTVRAIQQANRMGRRTTVRLGERLRVPGAAAEE
jgi:LysM repeat protein